MLPFFIPPSNIYFLFCFILAEIYVSFVNDGRNLDRIRSNFHKTKTGSHRNRLRFSIVIFFAVFMNDLELCKCFTKRLAVFYCIIIRFFLQITPSATRTAPSSLHLSSVMHPFSIAPSIRSEKSNLFCRKVLSHRS